MQKGNVRVLTRKERNFQILNLSLNIAIIIFLIALAIYYFTTSNVDNRQYACIGNVGFSLLPLLFYLCSKGRIPPYLYFFINIYIIFAGVWGSALSGYSTYWWFDIVIHSFMGYAAASVGLFVLCFAGEHRSLKIFTVALFCISFSLFIEGIWEIFEFIVDLIWPSMQMQGENFADQAFPLVTDTMVDIICNFLGATVFFLHYIIAKIVGKNLGIDSMIRQYSMYDSQNKKGNAK